MKDDSSMFTTTFSNTFTTTFSAAGRVLACGALLVGLAACSDDDGGSATTFEGPDGDFIVVFPDEPTEDEIVVPFPDGTSVTSPVFIHETRTSAFLMSWTDYPEQFDMSDTDAVLEGARDGAIGNIGGTLDRSDEVTLSGRPGLEIAGSADAGGTDAVYYSRVFIDDRRLYQAAVVGEADSDDIEDDARAFLESFEFTTSDEGDDE